MSDLTVETASTNGGFYFHRSDGKRFFLVYKDDGSAVLYAGDDRENPPQTGIVSLDLNVSDKLGVARKWVLAYPEHPREFVPSEMVSESPGPDDRKTEVVHSA
jgi:hypothetical protein